MNTRNHFNTVAPRWDTIAVHDPEKVSRIIDDAGIQPGDTILDVGTGTGILVPHLLKTVGNGGEVIAIDIAETMIAIAADKHQSANVRFIHADFFSFRHERPVDLVIAYSVFPHFMDPGAFFRHARRLLAGGTGTGKRGKVVVAHSESRHEINGHHRAIGVGTISNDLPEIAVLENLARKHGFGIVKSVDNERYYCLVAETLT